MDTEYYNLYRVAGIVLLDATEDEAESYNTEYTDLELGIYAYTDEVLEQIMHGWVDEVYVNIPFERHIPENLLGQLADMGITVQEIASFRHKISQIFNIIIISKTGIYKTFTAVIPWILHQVTPLDKVHRCGCTYFCFVCIQCFYLCCCVGGGLSQYVLDRRHEFTLP